LTRAGRLKLRIEGARLRHFPASDRIEIDAAQIRAIAADGRVTLASAQRAVGTGDGSELQLLGGAEVTSEDAAGLPVVMRGDFLHVFFVTERVVTHSAGDGAAWCHTGAGSRAGIRPRRAPAGARRPPACRAGATCGCGGCALMDAPPPLVFITGASSGIGQALAARYAQAGWRLALVARRQARAGGLGAFAGPGR
jgi:hypothetical protein